MTASNLLDRFDWSRVAAVALGGESLFSPSASERVTRCLVVGLFIALPLFVSIQLSPTAWAPIMTLSLVLADPRRLAVRPVRVWWKLAACWMGLAILAAVSAVWSLDPRRSLFAGVVMAAYIGCGVVVVDYIAQRSDAQRERIWRALRSGAVISLIILTAIEIYSEVVDWDAARTFHKITFYGVLAAAVLLHDRDRATWLRALFLLLFFAIPTLLIGKTTGVNLMIGAGIVLFLLRVRRLDIWLLPIFPIYCLLALSAPWSIAGIYAWVDQSVIAGFDGVASFMARLELWKLMAPYIVENVWLGHGADTVRISQFIVHNVKYYDLTDIPSAHNMIFDQWYELGLLGVIVLLAVMGVMLAVIVRSSCRYSLGAAIIFLGFLVEFSVDHRIWLSWVHGTVVFAVAALALMVLPRESETGAP